MLKHMKEKTKDLLFKMLCDKDDNKNIFITSIK
jgi:hypothetical protein